MPTPLESLIASGTKLWLDSVDPDLVEINRGFGATGATSNPIIISGLINSGRFDDLIAEQIAAGLDDAAVAWAV
ncbi:MAG: transaldolase, partial [Planctomycetota bacterium]